MSQDEITFSDGEVYVNGEHVGKARPRLFEFTECGISSVAIQRRIDELRIEQDGGTDEPGA